MFASIATVYTQLQSDSILLALLMLTHKTLLSLLLDSLSFANLYTTSLNHKSCINFVDINKYVAKKMEPYMNCMNKQIYGDIMFDDNILQIV